MEVMVQVDEIRGEREEGTGGNHIWMFFGRSACAVWAVNRGIIVLRD